MNGIERTVEVLRKDWRFGLAWSLSVTAVFVVVLVAQTISEIFFNRPFPAGWHVVFFLIMMAATAVAARLRRRHLLSIQPPPGERRNVGDPCPVCGAPLRYPRRCLACGELFAKTFDEIPDATFESN